LTGSWEKTVKRYWKGTCSAGSFINNMTNGGSHFGRWSSQWKQANISHAGSAQKVAKVRKKKVIRILAEACQNKKEYL
jgi:hypothetical protein